jgi:N-glycosylase/DNA lyase
MFCEEKDKEVVLYDIDSFNIRDILECGQCFRFEKLDDCDYNIVAFGRLLNIKQTQEAVILSPCTLKEFNDIWYDYFDMGRDYSSIKEMLSYNDSIMAKASDFAQGIRILRQDPLECMVSFIISQNNRIPMIRKVIANISKEAGECIVDGYYSFPSLMRLCELSEDKLKECKAGFRAKYIKHAVYKIYNNDINLAKMREFTTEDIKKSLTSVKGIGEKVSDCILLFSFGRTEVFPIDVWIKRIIQHFYFNNSEVPLKEIQSFAKDKFAENAGFAQQYLFHFARLNKIGV